MKKLCDWLDRHRDGMLDPEAQRQFEAHLKICEKCRTRALLLNNLVRVIQKRPLPRMTKPPEEIAASAYRERWSWDFLCISWLRPGAAWSGLALLTILVAFLWGSSSIQSVSADSAYEILMNESDSITARGNILTTLANDEFEAWLETGVTGK